MIAPLSSTNEGKGYNIPIREMILMITTKFVSDLTTKSYLWCPVDRLFPIPFSFALFELVILSEKHMKTNYGSRKKNSCQSTFCFLHFEIFLVFDIAVSVQTPSYP